MASPRGFEPPTYSLGNRCSILLSYGDKYDYLHSYYMCLSIFRQIQVGSKDNKKTLASQGFLHLNPILFKTRCFSQSSILDRLHDPLTTGKSGNLRYPH